ncbi:Copper amine oxidase N-terminal domain-containing protein [Paenibacillaceae bacterium GAS479]|nr:Copper amine oxidase N-terminal domain-containing protein [Paenibacillaceae bacterium GAS479]
MKRVVKIGLAGLLLTSVFGAGAYAATTAPKIFVHGNLVKTDAAPKIINGTVYVPLRAISEGLGVDIQWDNKKKTVYVNSDPNYNMEMETGNVSYVSNRDLAFRWIMAYDDRRHKDVETLSTTDFKTDIYTPDGFPSGTWNMASIVDMRPVARSNPKSADSKMPTMTVRIVQRVSSMDEYKVKMEDWKFTIAGPNKIKSVMIVPKSTKYFDRYTLFPGVTFGI